jgi:hypothetical protein
MPGAMTIATSGGGLPVLLNWPNGGLLLFAPSVSSLSSSVSIAAIKISSSALIVSQPLTNNSDN